MALVWCESATAATRDFSFWDSTGGTVSSDGTTTKYGGRSLKIEGDINSRVIKSLTATSGRATFWVNLSADSSSIMKLDDASNATVFEIKINASDNLQITNGSSFKTGGGIAILTWTRICVTWNIVSSTNWSVKVYATETDDDTQTSAQASASNTDFSLLTTSVARLRFNGISSGSSTSYYSPVVVDGVSDLSDMGDVRVTAKLPNATGNANNFSTVIGASASRWTAISERALSLTNGWQEIGTTSVEESYGIQNAATGDVNLTGKTIFGRMAWLYGKRDVYAATTTTSVTSSTKATTTALPSVSVTNGDWIVIAIADQILGTAITVAKTAGTSTIGTITQLSGPSTSTVRLTKWYVNVTGSGTLTLTFTHDNSAGKRAAVLAAFPSISASPLDINATNTTDGTSQYDGPASGTLAQANELVVGLFAFAGPSTDNIAVVGSTDAVVISDGTSGGSATANATLYMIARAVEVTTTVTQSMTDATSNRAGVQGLASFKMSAGGGAGSPKLINNGSDVSIVLTSSNQLFWDIVTSASYPSAAGVVGMKSTGNLNDTYLYECGMLIVYASPAVNTYTHTPDGGASAIGGTTTTEHSKIWAPNSGATVSGTDLGIKTKVFAPSGGMQSAGTGVHLVNIVHTPDGGATAICGGFTFLKEKLWAPNSGAQVSGTPVKETEKVFIADGGLIQTGGTGAHSAVIVHLPDGGSTATGGAAILVHFKDWAPNSGVETGGTATFLKLKEWTGSGGAATSGQALLERVKEWLGSGGISAGDTAPVLKIKIWAPDSGIQTGGTAPKEYEPAGQTSNEFEHFPDGGATAIGGAFAFVKEKTFLPDGLLIQAGGSALFLKVKSLVGSGGAQLSGAAALQHAKEWLASGGLTASGHPTTIKIKVMVPDGGSLATGGTGTHFVVIVHVGDGGVSLSSDTAFQKEKDVAGSGGASAAGSASAIKVKVFDPDGNLVYVSGSAEKEWFLSHTFRPDIELTVSINRVLSLDGTLRSQAELSAAINQALRLDGTIRTVADLEATINRILTKESELT